MLWPLAPVPAHNRSAPTAAHAIENFNRLFDEFSLSTWGPALSNYWGVIADTSFVAGPPRPGKLGAVKCDSDLIPNQEPWTHRAGTARIIPSHYARQAAYFGLRATFTVIRVVFCGSSPHFEEPSAPGAGQN